ncbi:MAG: hypothetical protein AB1611_15020 [bacterium]
MPEQNEPKPEYFEKYLEMRFQRIDEAIMHIDQKVAHIDQRVEHIDQRVEYIDQKVETIKADNQTTRRWVIGTVVGTGLVVLFGMAAIFLSFAQIQTSWMQQVISFGLKAIK